MAKQRSRQFEPSKTGPSKLGFDGEEDSWVFVKKQRVIIVLPSLPLPEHFTPEKPETSQSQAELRDGIADMQAEATPVHHTVGPPLPIPEQFILQKPETSLSQAELGNTIADMHETTLVHTVVPSLPLPEHFTLQKHATSHSQVRLNDSIGDKLRETTPLHTVVSSLPVTEHFTVQKPATSQSQAGLRAVMRETSLAHTVVPSLHASEHCTLQKPGTSQSQAELGADKHESTSVYTAVPSLPLPDRCTLQKPATFQSQADVIEETTLVHTVVPSLPVTEHGILEKPAASRSQSVLRDLVPDAHEATHVYPVEPESCPDFTAVDKPEMVRSRNLTTRKAPAPAPRRSLQDFRMHPNRRVENQRSRTGRKPIRFPRVMCSSVVMDNEKLRVVNLEKKVEKAGGLNEWVGSIGLGREFERMLRGQRMNKFQVANLTMEKLKHMGALAVGPRRKLIHAIHCVYHPHCLRASFN